MNLASLLHSLLSAVENDTCKVGEYVNRQGALAYAKIEDKQRSQKVFGTLFFALGGYLYE